jgi:glucosylceramidase
VAPQNEPTFDQNYPSCLWDAATYTSFIGKFLGPAMKAIDVKVILGLFANSVTGGGDLLIASTALADAAATSFLYAAGVQWNVLDSVNNGTTTMGGLPVWATTHKAGNYPFCTGVNSYCPGAYNATHAPNDQAYGVESWGYIRNAITKGKVTSYNAWNMVLDDKGLGIDTSRDWKQDALLLVDGGKVNPTPAYYVFRHFSQYVVPGATVVATTGGDAVAFKNPDGSLVAVVYNSGAANNKFIVAMGGKKLQLAMPANGWATVKLTP